MSPPPAATSLFLKPAMRDVFWDRLTESESISIALQRHRMRLDTDDPVEGPRGRNVFSLHGHGGIGKSALSQRLQRWVTGDLADVKEWGQVPATPVRATARVDFHGSGGFVDGADILASLRLQVGHMRQEWHLFDLAFAAYWSSTRRGQALPIVGAGLSEELIGSLRELLSGLTQDVANSDLVQGTDTAPSVIASIATLVLQSGAARIVNALKRRFTIAPPQNYDVFVSRCSTEPSTDNPVPDLVDQLFALLAYQIATAGDPLPLVVVFIDTFERLVRDERRTTEGILNRAIYAMDNVLFVVTGRDRLAWAGLDQLHLDRCGPSVWPLLAVGAADEPRQHDLGYLPEADARGLLLDFCVVHGVQLPPQLVDAVVIRSGGLPEYLRLVVLAAKTLDGSGLELTEALADASLDALVDLLLADLADESVRSAARAAALFATPTVELVSVAADVTQGTALQALRSALFASVHSSAGHFSMHDVVRHSLRGAKSGARGGWTDGDWRLAARRVLASLRARADALRATYRSATRADDADRAAAAAAGLLEAIGLAISVIAEVDVDVQPGTSTNYPNWIVEAVFKGPSIRGLLPLIPTTTSYTRAKDLVDVIRSSSLDLPLEERIAIRRLVFESRRELSWIAGRHLAYALSDGGRYDECFEIFEELLTERPDSLFIRYQRSIRLVVARRYAQADATRAYLSPRNSETTRRRLRLAHGEPEEYVDWLRDLARRGPASGAIKDALENEGAAARWSAITARAWSGEQLANLLARCQAAGHVAAARDAALATLLTFRRWEGAEWRLLDGKDIRADHSPLGYRSALLLTAMAFHEDDEDALRRLRERIDRRDEFRSSYWVPVEFLLEHTGYRLRSQRDTEWLDKRSKVARRWATVWDGWKLAKPAAGE